MNLKFIKDLQDIVNELTYQNDDSISFINEKDLNFFIQTLPKASQVSSLKERMTNDFNIIKNLVEEKHLDIQEKQNQNKGIMKITDALNNVGNMLDQTTVNSFPLSEYRQSLDDLIEKLEEDYCFSPEEIDEDLTQRLNEAGEQMNNFFNILEKEIEQEEALMPPKEEIAELVKKIFLDYELATYLLFEARKFERTKK